MKINSTKVAQIAGVSRGTVSRVMLADVFDYGEFKFGSRNESVIFSVQTLLVKSASAIKVKREVEA